VAATLRGQPDIELVRTIDRSAYSDMEEQTCHHPRRRQRMADHDARFKQLYEDNSHLILCYALRRTSEPEDAADVVAETFTVAWRRRDEVPDGGQGRLWLYGVARRVLANQRRGRLRRDRLTTQLHDELPRLGALVTAPADDADLEAIAAAFRRLPGDDREILALVGWEGLDREEVAQVLGCSRANVRVRLHRARRRFARELEMEMEQATQRSSVAGHESDRWAVAHPGRRQAL